MTHEELMALPFNPGWDDGRVGYEWARFDALVDGTDRAEVTWDDRHKNGRHDYYQPELLLETNRKVGDELRRVDYVVLSLTEEEARQIINSPPSSLKRKYAHLWAKLKRG